MRLLKKFTIVILSVILILSNITFAAGLSAEEQKSDAMTAIKCLMPDFPDDDEIITRGELAKIAVDILGASGIKASKDYFYDVTAAHIYADEINVCTELGVFNGSGGGMFEPDVQATAGQAVKVLLKILGYELQVKLNGGYPVGDMIVANSLGIRNVEFDAPLSVYSMSELLYKFLDVSVMRETAVGDGRIEITQNDDLTLLYYYLGCVKIEGRLTANTKTNMSVLSGASGLGVNSIIIDDVLYTCAYQTADEFIGLNVIAFYNSESEEIVYISAAKGQNILEICGEQVYSISGDTICYEDESGEYKEYLDDIYNVIYNGVFTFAFDIELLKSDTAYITLADTDKNGYYDLVKVWDYTNYLISKIDKDNMKIIDVYDRTLDLSGFDGNNIYIYEAATGNKMDFDVLSADDLLCVSFGGNPSNPIDVTICVVNQRISGVVTSYDFSEREAEIDGVVYKITDEYVNLSGKVNNYIDIKVGTEAVFYLDKNGKIAVVTSETGLAYGYVMGAAADWYEGCRLKIMSGAGASKVYSLADNYKLVCGDTIQKCSSGADTIPYICENGATNYQLIRFKVNGSDKITEIHIAEDYTGYMNPSAGLSSDYDVISSDSDKFRLYVSSESMNQRTEKFSTKYSYNGSTKVFNIVKVNGVPDEEKSTIESSSFIAANIAYNVKLYDMNRFWVSNAIVLEKSVDAGTRSDVANTQVSLQYRVGIITKVSKGLNGEGNEIVKITLTQKGTEASYYVDPEYTHDMLIDSAFYNQPLDLGVGDLIQYVADGSMLTYIRKVLDYSKDTGFERYYVNTALTLREAVAEQKEGETLGSTWNSRNVTADNFENYVPTDIITDSAKDALRYCHAYYGTVVDVNESEMIVNAFWDLRDGTNNDKIFEWCRLFHLISAGQVYCYKSDKETVTKVSYSDIMPGDKVYVVLEWNNLREIVIYR